MKEINLMTSNSEDFTVYTSKFPDGQKNVTLIERSLKGETNYHVNIISRMNNFSDLEMIICITKALNNLGYKHIHLYCPYFLGSRSDRQFEYGSTNYLKDVICPIINSLRFESVKVLDPHSDVLEACLNNFIKESNDELVQFAFNRLEYSPLQKEYMDNCIFVSPDAGASKKIYKLVDKLGIKSEIVTCSKDRDEKGKLTKAIVPDIKDKRKPIFIIDDICDGGQTFINIADEIKKEPRENKIYLIVTHGIFSKGFAELEKRFDRIFCTNSYSDLQSYTVLTQLDLFNS